MKNEYTSLRVANSKYILRKMTTPTHTEANEACNNSIQARSVLSLKMIASEKCHLNNYEVFHIYSAFMNSKE